MTIDEILSKYDEFKTEYDYVTDCGLDPDEKQLVKDIDHWLQNDFADYMYANSNDPTATAFHTAIASRLSDMANTLRKL